VRSARGVAVLALAASLAACGGSSEASVPEADETLRLAGSASSLDELGESVLDALVRQDTTTLERFRLDERQHNEVVWPELPASAPEVNFPVDYAWTNIQNRNRRSLTRILGLFADRSPGLEAVECRGTTERFATFEVLTDCWVVFTADGSPGVWEAQLFKDVLIRGGSLKVFRYYDEAPRRYRGGSGR
jgi:hypothetical protein